MPGMHLVVLALATTRAASAVAGLRGAKAAVFEGNVGADTAEWGGGAAAEAGALSSFFQGVRHVGARMVGRVTGQKQQQEPTPAETGGEASGSSYIFRILLQLVFGAIYYVIIVRKYPEMPEGNMPSKDMKRMQDCKEMQDQNAIQATCSPNMSFANAGLAFACSGPRAAHTFHSVGLMNYWLGCCLMTCLPCCTLFYTNACTSLNERLGGEKQNPFMACLCAFCCSCCLIAQDAQTLDFATGAKTGFCYVTNSV